MTDSCHSTASNSPEHLNGFMHITYWGTYDTGKPRLRLILKGLRAAGVNVSESHSNIWEGISDKSQMRGATKKAYIVLRWLLSYPRLIWNLLRAPQSDILVVGYPGILDMLIVAPIAKLRGIPLAWDMFISLYDTVVNDRKLVRAGGTAARLLYWLERIALRRADFVFLDTLAHARYIEGLFHMSKDTVGAVWVGAETDIFHAQANAMADNGNVEKNRSTIRVLFYGQFIPLHGIETIVQAACLMHNEPVEWELIGTGQESGTIQALLDEQPLPKLHWDPWVSYEKLPLRIASADLCLGIFGDSHKAANVIPNKVFQVLAMDRPLITRDSAAIRELLHNEPGWVYLVPPRDPHELAQAIRKFIQDRKQPTHDHVPRTTTLGPALVGEQCATLLSHRFGIDS